MNTDSFFSTSMKSPMREVEKRIYRFADFTLEASEHRLRRGLQEVYLPPKTLEALLYLVERRGHLVKKDELLDAVWTDVAVGDNTLAQRIKEVRQALGDDVHNPLYIKTIPRVGYRFIAEVEEITSRETEEEYAAQRDVVSEDDRQAEVKASQTEENLFVTSPTSTLEYPSGIRTVFNTWRQGRKLFAVSVALGLIAASGLYLYQRSGWAIQSLAVLPFDNLSGDPEQDYFADGMTEALITDLAKIGALRVISRTSVMRYRGTHRALPEIARELNVDVVLEGSVLRDGEHVRITAQLINARTDRHLWAETYERDLRDMLALQRDVSRAVVEQIKIKVTPHEQAQLARVGLVHPAAYEDYLRGRYLLQQADRRWIQERHQVLPAGD